MGERKFHRNLRHRESRRAVCLCCVHILCFCSENYGKVWQHVGCQRCNVPAIQCRNLCVVTAKTQIHTRTHIHLPKRSIQNKQKDAVSFVAPTVFVSLPRGVSSRSFTIPFVYLSFVLVGRHPSKTHSFERVRIPPNLGEKIPASIALGNVYSSHMWNDGNHR